MQTRRDERYPLEQKVTVKVAGREGLQEMYAKDISRGGLFIATERRFQLREAIQVEIRVADDDGLTLEGEVVHQVTPEQAQAWKGPVGIGVQFTSLDPAQKQALEDYLSGLRKRLNQGLERAPFDSSLLEEVEAANRRNDLFAALGLGPSADAVQILLAIDVRQTTLVKQWQAPQIGENLRNRIARAIAGLERSSAVLSDPEKRLQYIYRTGLLKIEDLAVQAQEVPEVGEEIARQWCKRYPEQAETGRRLEHLARQALQMGDLPGAQRSAELALKQNPFLFALRQDLAAWKKA